MLHISTLVNFKQADIIIGDKHSRGWKSWIGYLREAKEWAICVMRNGRRLQHHIVINIDIDFTEQQHKTLWSILHKGMTKANVDGVWAREMNSTGRWLHYHILTVSTHDPDKLHDKIRDAIPAVLKPFIRVYIEPIEHQHAIANYVVKRKVSGYCDGKWSKDKWRSRRRLFLTECTLRKVGTIGNFWIRPKADIWQDVIAEERGIAQYKSTETYNEARHLEDMCERWKEWRAIERTICRDLWLDDLAKQESNGKTSAEHRENISEKTLPETTLGHEYNTYRTTIRSLLGEANETIQSMA